MRNESMIIAAFLIGIAYLVMLNTAFGAEVKIEVEHADIPVMVSGSW